jgi:hypothetical protein
MLVFKASVSVLGTILKELRRRIGAGCHDDNQAVTIFWFVEAPKTGQQFSVVISRRCTIFE